MLSLLYPRLCPVCGHPLLRGEGLMCLGCRMELPLTGYHLSDTNDAYQRVTPVTPLVRTAAYFYYQRDSDYGRMLHRAKYGGRPSLLRRLTREYAEMLHAEQFFDGIDMVAPVPMHIFKRWRRGYNQAEYVARGVADVTGLPVCHCLKARHPHLTQTRLDQSGRWANTAGIYSARPGCAEALDGCHLLVVDDILTTGATLTACINALAAAVPTATFSILTLASTRF